MLRLLYAVPLAALLIQLAGCTISLIKLRFLVELFKTYLKLLIQVKIIVRCAIHCAVLLIQLDGYKTKLHAQKVRSFSLFLCRPNDAVNRDINKM